MSLKNIASLLEAMAAAEWQRVVSEGVVLEQKLEVVVEDSFEALIEQLGPYVMQTITNLATNEFANLSGSEKNNLAVTTVVDRAEQQGITILAQDATALVKNAFIALTGSAPAGL